jgi:parallel beta-helix repeat protein
MRGGFRAWAGRILWLVALLAVSVAMPPPAVPGTTSVAASALQVHSPIYIQGDANFTWKNGVTNGTAGTAANPYVIQGWNISAVSTWAIAIRYTTAFFIIRDVTVHDGNLTSHEGIYLLGVANAVIERVTSYGNTEGIRIDRSNHVTVTASTLRSNSGFGLTIQNSQNVRIQGNDVMGGAQAAIALGSDSDASVLSNHVSGAHQGIWLYNTVRATVSGNEVKWNLVGITLQGTDGVVTNNTLLRNSDTGLEALSTGPVDLTWNDVSANGNYGFHLYRWTGVMHHNHFGLYQRGWDADGHYWDGGYPTGGNWWIDYTGLDRCSGPAQDICPKQDGFGDTPMLVIGGSQDRYPRIFPDKPPTARFTMGPASPLVYEPVTFNASTSSDPDGKVVDFTWNFGDGVKASGVVVRHAFAAPGSYHVTLDIMDNGSGIDRAVHDLTIQPLAFVTYVGSAGFRILVPKDWTLNENVALANRTVALQLLGPVRATVPTSVLLATEGNAAVREDTAYLDAAMDTTVQGLRLGSVSAVRTQEPLHRTIAGHLSVTFVVQYGTTNLFQKVVLIVSEAHQRSWTFTLTSSGDFYETSNAILERMLTGFEITVPPAPRVVPLSDGQILLGVAFGPALIAFLVTAVLVGRMNRRKKLRPARSPPPRSQRPVPPRAPTRTVRGSTSVQRPVLFCPRCGTPATKGSVCAKCGTLLRS